MDFAKTIKLTFFFVILFTCTNVMGQNNDKALFSDKEKFEDFIYTNTHYPLIDFATGTEGVAVFKYESDSIHKTYQLKIVQSSGSSTLDREGKRLLYLIPGQNYGYPEHEISIHFKIEDNKIYSVNAVLENPPVFPGGESEMIKFISKNLEFSPEAAESSIQGTIICGFVVEKDGSIGPVEILSPLDRYVDAEAIRVIKRMPKWEAGKMNGRPVRVYFIIPIKIKLL
jgi:hypothetical protein